jgi:hypothetical protein
VEETGDKLRLAMSVGRFSLDWTSESVVCEGGNMCDYKILFNHWHVHIL